MRRGCDLHARAPSWSNWAGDQRCMPRALERPATIEQLRACMERAVEDSRRVRVVGSGHSFSDIACTDGMMVSLARMRRLLDVDRGSGLARVQAGITIRELNGALHEHGLALENVGDIDAQTLAGAISTATLGAIAEITLSCVPGFTLHGVDAPAPLEEVLERFEELALGNDHFEFFVFPHAKTALTRTNNRTELPPRPPRRLAAYANDVLLANRAFGLFCRAGRRFPSQIPRLNRIVTALAGRRERVDRSAAIFASPRLVRFTEMEYAVPRAEVPTAVRRVLELVRQRGFAVPFPIEARTVAPDDAFLSTACGRDSGFVAVHMYRGMQWEPYFRAVEAIMDELGGRPHWGKRHFQTAATLRARYPDWDRFQSARARLDPHGRFANAWSDRVLGPVRALSPS